MARLRWIGGRLADLGTGFVDTFLRGNRVLPPILAVMALFVVAWLLAGVLLGGGANQEPVAQKADLAQSDSGANGGADGGAPGPDPVTPGVENRDVDSYAAYRSKDPFREVLAPDKTTQEKANPQPEDTTGAGRRERGPSAGGGAKDTDNDGVPDRRERNIPSDPNNPDTDGDGIPDGADDANNDGQPDGGAAGAGAGGGRGADDRTAGQGKGQGKGRGGDLLDSGGILPLP